MGKKFIILLRYLFCHCYDLLVLIALWFAITAVCLLMTRGRAIVPATHWYQLLLSLAGFLYYFFSISYGGQTIGMRAWHFQIVSEQSTLGFYQITGRLLLFLPAVLLSLCRGKNPQALLFKWTKTRLIGVKTLA